MCVGNRLNFSLSLHSLPRIQELAARKTKVLETLIQLQEEVAPITNITEKLKDSDNIKDSKAFVTEIQQEFGVNIPISNVAQISMH